MKIPISFITYLSDALNSCYTETYAFWNTNYSDQTFFDRAKEKFHFAMLSDGYSNTDIWATYRVENSLWFAAQTIPVTMLTQYGQAAEPQRDDGAVRSRMAFRRPPYQGLEGPGGPTKKQRAIRRQFKSTINSFDSLGLTSRSEIYTIATAAGMWYYNYYIKGTIDMIKNVYVYKDQSAFANPFTLIFSTNVDARKTVALITGGGWATNESNYPYFVPFYLYSMTDGYAQIDAHTQLATETPFGLQLVEFY